MHQEVKDASPRRLGSLREVGHTWTEVIAWRCIAWRTEEDLELRLVSMLCRCFILSINKNIQLVRRHQDLQITKGDIHGQHRNVQLNFVWDQRT